MAHIIANTLKRLLTKTVIVEFTHANSKLPFYSTEGAAGADIYAAEGIIIPARQKVLIKTGLKVQIPRRHYLRIESRSGLSAKFSLEKGAGIIDEDFSGEVCVILHNHSDNEYVVESGERVAQFILQKYVRARFVQGIIKRKSKRGTGGFGSTGRK